MEEAFAVSVVLTRHVSHGIADMEDDAVVAVCSMRHVIHEMPAQEEFAAARCGLHEMRRP